MIGIVAAFFGMPTEVADRMTLFLKVKLDRFFQLEAAAVRSQRDLRLHQGNWTVWLDARSLLDELQHRSNALLDLVATGQVNFVRTANRIADIVLVTVQRFVELTEQKSFFSRVGIQHRNGIDMAVSHAKNVIRLLNQIGRQHMTALLGDVDAKFLERANRMFAGRKPIDRSDSRRHDPEIISSFNGMPKEPLSHGTATDIAGADEKNCLHSANQSFELGEQADIRQREINWSGIAAPR